MVRGEKELLYWLTIPPRAADSRGALPRAIGAVRAVSGG
jgi:hypothetical protein